MLSLLPHPPVLPPWPTLTFCLSLWVMSWHTASLSLCYLPSFVIGALLPHTLSVTSHLPSGKYLTDGLNWKQQHVCKAQGQWSVIDLLCCIHKAIIYSMSRCSRVCPHMVIPIYTCTAIFVRTNLSFRPLEWEHFWPVLTLGLRVQVRIDFRLGQGWG